MKRTTRGLVAALLVLPLTGCSFLGDDEPATPGAAPVASAAAEPKPSQPFDILQGEKVGLIEHAQAKLQFRCMADSGYPQNQEIGVPAPVNPFEGLVIGAGSLGPMTEAEARRQGFGHDMDAERPALVSNDVNFDKAGERCDEKAWDDLGAGARETVWAYYELTNQLGPYRKELDRKLPGDLAGKMLECITGAGYRPADREQFLKTPNPDQLGVTFGDLEPTTARDWEPRRRSGTIDVGPAIPARRYVPTPEEADLAVDWYRCRQETDMLGAYLAAARPVQQTYVDRYESQITELNAKVEELSRAAATLAAN
ncbi:hypothetical protein AB0M02_39770 [Actinoplanes sp. NPDC051861]|uniref:hypothetical protein n=1 Tax=Actinoplanes sp. NPDC051861 TaxID=3155170 RepID=UPI0034223BE3